MTQARRLFRSIAVLVFVVGMVAPAAIASVRNAASGPATRLRVERVSAAGHATSSAGRLSPAQRMALSRGYAVPDEAAYAAAKARAAQRAGSGSPAAGTSALAPVTGRSWEGLRDTNFGPSDSTGAIGTSRYIEMVNSKYAIYARTKNRPTASGTLNELVGTPGDVFDPQVIWDPDTKRFYYATDRVVSSTENYIMYGYSKTSTPASGSDADWCKFQIGTGSDFYDYPKLGDMRGLVLIGSNVFAENGFFVGSALWSLTKPAAGSTTCDAASIVFDEQRPLLNKAGNQQTFTPVPANEIDKVGTGWVVSRALSMPSTAITLYKVTMNNDGTMSLATPRTISVGEYTVPPNAPQPSTTNKIDTSDARMTQAVGAIDPDRGGFAVWTQHTISGGAGSQVRWYEINVNVNPPTLYQFGTVLDAQVFCFNGAVSPDRVVKGNTKAFGSNMVLGFNTSSSAQFADIRMVSKVGAGGQTAPVTIKGSASSLNDFTCGGGTCRWGDYAAATPDPNADTTLTRGVVWLTSQWVKESGGPSGSGWSTWNWSAKP